MSRGQVDPFALPKKIMSFTQIFARLRWRMQGTILLIGPCQQRLITSLFIWSFYLSHRTIQHVQFYLNSTPLSGYLTFHIREYVCVIKCKVYFSFVDKYLPPAALCLLVLLSQGPNGSSSLTWWSGCFAPHPAPFLAFSPGTLGLFNYNISMEKGKHWWVLEVKVSWEGHKQKVSILTDNKEEKVVLLAPSPGWEWRHYFLPAPVLAQRFEMGWEEV